MHIHPYLNFDGNCAEAFRFYEKALGGEIEAMMTYENSPMADEMSPAWKGRVMHASMKVGDARLMGADSQPDNHLAPQGLYVSLHITDVPEAERVWKELSEGGSVEMDLQQTFWAARFGVCTDRFGTPWMINCDESSSENPDNE